MLTGMLPRKRAHLNNGAIDKFISSDNSKILPETFIHHFKNNGYHTIGIGKISHSPDGYVYGYEDSISQKKELPLSWSELVYDYGKWGTGWNSFFGYANGDNRQGLKKQVKPYENADVTDEDYPDGLIAKQALIKLREAAGRDEPFFMGVGFFKPHLPFTAPKKYWDLYNQDSLPLAPFASIPENVSRASLQNSGEFNGYQLGDEKASLDAQLSDDYARKLRHGYFASISYTDAQVGKLLDELERLGLAENTIVVLWGDHGWNLGDYRVWGKHTLFERSLRSAFMIKTPGDTKKNEVNNIVSSIDIYPTLVDLSGLEMPHTTDGRSLIPYLNGNKTTSELASYGYYRKGITARTDRYRLSKYFRDEKPVVELFDHVSDPFETKNIAASNPEIVAELMPILEKGNLGLFDEE
jgi:arylsulfatase A-like enzyme